MSYIGNSPGVSSQRVVTEEVISGSAKSAFYPVGGYALGYVDVLINGLEVDSSDFTATDGVVVTLGTAAAVGDTVKIKAYIPRGLSDGYLKSEADALLATKAADSSVVKLTGDQTVAGVKTFSSQPVMSAGVSLGSNGQIKFPATQNPSGDANTLDDYEEGTWTPTLVGGTDPTVVYLTQRGNYVKIGRQVFASFYLAITSFSGGSGAARIGGLPFVVSSIGGVDDNGGSINEHNGVLSYPAGRTWVSLYAVNGSTRVPLIANGSGVGGSDMTLGTNFISTAGGYVLGSITYTSA